MKLKLNVYLCEKTKLFFLVYLLFGLFVLVRKQNEKKSLILFLEEEVKDY